MVYIRYAINSVSASTCVPNLPLQCCLPSVSPGFPGCSCVSLGGVLRHTHAFPPLWVYSCCSPFLECLSSQLTGTLLPSHPSKAQLRRRILPEIGLPHPPPCNFGINCIFLLTSIVLSLYLHCRPWVIVVLRSVFSGR